MNAGVVEVRIRPVLDPEIREQLEEKLTRQRWHPLASHLSGLICCPLCAAVVPSSGRGTHTRWHLDGWPS